MDKLAELRAELENALRDKMGEPEFSKWYVDTFRDKLAEVKRSRENRGPGSLPRRSSVTTSDLTRTESFLAAGRDSKSYRSIK